MRKNWFKILAFLLISGAASAGAFLNYFQARTDNENVIVEWKSGTESNLNHYAIERRTPQTSYVEITQVAGKGSNSSYTYLDQSVYKAENMVFTYRLKIVDNNQQSTYSSEVSAAPNISGVKRTWGSIKAMFR